MSIDPALDPMAGTDTFQPDRNVSASGTNPMAASMDGRLTALHDAGGGWLEPQAQAALVASPLDTQSMLAASDALRRIAIDTGAWARDFFADPVIRKQATPAARMSAWMTGTLGPLNVGDPDLQVIQRRMQAAGFGTGLPVTGTWDGAWQQAYLAAADQHYQEAKRGKGKPLTTTASDAFGRFLNAIAPSRVASALVGYVKSMPAQARQLLADAVGASVNAFDPTPIRNIWGGAPTSLANSPGARVGAAIQNVANQKRVTPAEFEDSQNFQRLATDTLNLLMFIPVAKGGTAVAQTVGRGVTTRGIYGAEVAARSPGVLVNTLLGRQTAEATNGYVGGLLRMRPFANIPVLRRTTPVLQRFYAPAESGAGMQLTGLYYRGRTVLAQPMRVPTVNALADASNRTLVGGAGLVGATAITSKIDPNNPEVQGVYSVPRVGGRLGLALDVAGGIGRPYRWPTTGPASEIGDTVNAVREQMDNALGTLGVQYAFEAGTGLRYEDLVAEIGPEAAVNHVNDKVRQFAATRYAEQAVEQTVIDKRKGEPLPQQEYLDEIRRLENEVKSDPALWQQARDDLLTNLVDVEQRFARDTNTILARPSDKAMLSDIKTYTEAAALARQLIADHGQVLISPLTREKQAAQTEAAADRIVASTRGVGERFAPNQPALFHASADGTPQVVEGTYARGIPASESPQRAQRMAPVLSSLTHTGAQPPTVVDLDSTGAAARPFANQLVRDLAPNRPESAAARAELGITPGMTPAQYPEEYRLLRAAMRDKFSSPKRILDTYRVALKAAGVDAATIRQRTADLTATVAERNGYTAVRYTDSRGTHWTLLRPEAVAATEKNRIPSVEATQEWLRANNPTAAPGKLGMARLDTQTAQSAARLAATLAQQLRRAGIDPSKALNQVGMDLELGPPPPGMKPALGQRTPGDEQVWEKAAEYLVKELNVHPESLTGMPADVLVAEIYRRSANLASEVNLPTDAPAEAQELVQRLAGLGYRMVYGTDIGWHLTDPPIPDIAVAGAATARRRMTEVLGLGLRPYAVYDPAQFGRIAIIREWQKAINNGKITAPPGYDAARLLDHLYDNISVPLSPGSSMLFAFARRNFRLQAETMAAMKNPNPTKADIETEYNNIRQAIAQSSGGLRNISRRDFIDSITQDVAPVSQALGGTALTRRDADILYSLMLKAMASRPMSLVGAAKFEDMFRSSLSVLGRSRLGALPSVARIGTLPNDLIRLRDRWRFEQSPLFALRLVAKTTFRKGLSGADQVTFTPYRDLVESGRLDHATELLNKVMPDDRRIGLGYDALDRMLNQQSVTGFYNVRHHMAFMAENLYQQGLSDKQIKERLTAAFLYGKDGKRTPLERTVGTIFYPFSFDKMLYSKIGAWLFTYPGQRLALTAGLSAYSALDKQAGIGDWIEEHLPVMKELQKLNAFEKGFGPGMFGGINAPFLNLFMPQKWIVNGPESTVLQAVKAAMPLYSMIDSMLVGTKIDPSGGVRVTGRGTLVEQGKVTFWSGANALDRISRWATDNPRSPLDPARANLTTDAQLKKGWALRVKLVTALDPTIRYNYANPDNQIRWPAAFGPEVAGLPVNKTSISLLVNRYYPAFDPTKGTTVAVSKKLEATATIQRLKATDPGRAARFETFAKAADKVVGQVQRDEWDPQRLAKAVAAFREVAWRFSETDPEFQRFYEKNYQSTFGPLVDVTQ